MHKVGVIRFHFQPEKLREAILIWESLIDAARYFEGFKGCLLLTNQMTCKGVGLGFWENGECSSLFGNSEVYQDHMKKLSELQASPPTRELFDLDAGLMKSVELGRFAQVAPLMRLKGVGGS